MGMRSRRFIIRIVYPALTLLACSLGCHHQESQVSNPTITATDIAHSLETIESSATGVADSKDVVLPPGSDQWLVAAPYALESHRELLGTTVSDRSWHQLVEANRANENVLVARLSNSDPPEIVILSPSYAVSPSVMLLNGGGVLSVQRRKD